MAGFTRRAVCRWAAWGLMALVAWLAPGASVASAQESGALPVLSLREVEQAGPACPPAFLLAELPRVLVLAQPDLAQQGEQFGRLVAFLEKAGVPKTRLPALDEFRLWLRHAGLSSAALALGNNLDAGRLARFYNLARLQGEPLTRGEADLLVALLRWQVLARTVSGHAPGPGPALVLTFPLAAERVACEFCVSAAQSQAILGHEFQHALYHAEPGLQHYTEWYWFNRSPLALRSQVLRFLERRGYDTTQLPLVLDEFHAFLSPGGTPVWLKPGDWGLDAAGLNRLRADFAAGLAAFRSGS